MTTTTDLVGWLVNIYVYILWFLKFVKKITNEILTALNKEGEEGEEKENIDNLDNKEFKNKITELESSLKEKDKNKK